MLNNDSRPVPLTCGKIPSPDLAFTNCGFVHPNDFTLLKESAKEVGAAIHDGNEVRGEIRNGLVMNIRANKDIPEGTLAVNGNHRKTGRLPLNEAIDVHVHTADVPIIDKAQIICRPVGGSTGSLKDSEITLDLATRFKNHVFLSGQKFNIKCHDLQLELSLENGKMMGPGGKAIYHGRFDVGTTAEYMCDTNSGLKIMQTQMQTDKLFDGGFNFEALGIGGLDAEFQDIFRRAFASRVHPPHILEELGITHVKGMILHGPPGTGKTLIARQIGKALKCEEPKVVNGPEILNKYVGQSEENIRNLFKDAEEEQAKKGDQSNLHIIIFDELDAICKQRGSVAGGTGTNDSIVNQLLSKIDGVDALNNILIIGMTNRIDMMDEALLRPGRFECHIEIGLPDEPGRLQILRIHTANMKKANRLASDVDLAWLAANTKNFSGAELAGLCRSAASYALSREIDFEDLSKAADIDAIQIGKADFDKALDEVHAGFGADEEALEVRFRNGIIPFSSDFVKVKDSIEDNIKRQAVSTKNSVFSTLLYGIHGCGKTALACQLASASNYPYIKLISPHDDKLIGVGEAGKVSFINKIFNDAYKSDLSMIIIDDIERLLDYTPIGPRFSNMVLQTIINLVGKPPKADGRRLTVIATTSSEDFLRQVGMTNAFHVQYQVPAIKTVNQLRRILQNQPMEVSESEINSSCHEVEAICQRTHEVLAVKQVHTALDMAFAAGGGNVTGKAFMSALRDVGFGR